MKSRTTIILVLLTGALLAFIFIQEHRLPTTREWESLQTRPFSFQPADADEIRIEREGGVLRILLRDGSWRIASPFEDPADPDLVKQVLEAVPAVEWVETMKRDDLRKEDLKRTGLGEDAVTLTVRRKGEPLTQVAFGGPAALDGCVYASVPSQKNLVHVAKTALPALLGKADDEWRDPRLVRLSPDSVRRFTISAGNGAMEFARSDASQPWQLLKPIQTRASDDRVDAVMRELLKLKVRPAKSAPPETTAGAELPDLTITFEAEGQPKPVVLTFQAGSDPAAEIHVQADNREGAFLTPPNAAVLWRLQPSDLRDQNVVHIPEEQTTALRIRSLVNADVELDKRGETWMLTRFGKTEPANQERVGKLIATLNAAQVREFLSDAAGNLEPWGLHQPFLSIEWQAAGKTSVLEFGQGPNGIPTARLRDEPFIYRIGSHEPGTNLLSTIVADSLRWRSTKIVNVSLFAVRRIIIAEGDRPAMHLLHNPDNATWTGSIAGRDITDQLDKARANRLLQRLVEFQATDWNSDRAGALLALKNPTLTVQLLLANPAQPEAEARPVTLTFAPLQPGMNTAIYHGRKDDDPDTFFISRDLYHQLIAPAVR